MTLGRFYSANVGKWKDLKVKGGEKEGKGAERLRGKCNNEISWLPLLERQGNFFAVILVSRDSWLFYSVIQMRRYWTGKYADTRSNYWVCLPQSIPLLIRCAACKLAISESNSKHYVVLLSDLALSRDSISVWCQFRQTIPNSIVSVVRMWERLEGRQPHQEEAMGHTSSAGGCDPKPDRVTPRSKTKNPAVSITPRFNSRQVQGLSARGLVAEMC